MHAGVMYDAAAGMHLCGKCTLHGFRCVRSGMKRKSKETLLSNVASTYRQRVATMRVRVETKIGHGKNDCESLSGKLPIRQLAHMHKVVYVSYVLLNFNPPMMV